MGNIKAMFVPLLHFGSMSAFHTGVGEDFSLGKILANLHPGLQEKILLELMKSLSTATRTKAGGKKGDRLCPRPSRREGFAGIREGRRGSHLCRWRGWSLKTCHSHTNHKHRGCQPLSPWHPVGWSKELDRLVQSSHGGMFHKG